MRDAEAVEAVIGRIPNGMPGKAEGMKLCVQLFSDLSEKTQEALRCDWTPEFRNYTITPQSNSTVVGMVWDISQEERHTIEAWELVETGWYEVANIKVSTENNILIDATTEIIGPSQSYSLEVDEEEYPAFLNSKADWIRVAIEARHEL